MSTIRRFTDFFCFVSSIWILFGEDFLNFQSQPNLIVSPVLSFLILGFTIFKNVVEFRHWAVFDGISLILLIISIFLDKNARGILGDLGLLCPLRIIICEIVKNVERLVTRENSSEIRRLYKKLYFSGICVIFLITGGYDSLSKFRCLIFVSSGVFGYFIVDRFMCSLDGYENLVEISRSIREGIPGPLPIFEFANRLKRMQAMIFLYLGEEEGGRCLRRNFHVGKSLRFSEKTFDSVDEIENKIPCDFPASEGIVLFLEIAHFSEIAESLQKGVLRLVNYLAEIVHGVGSEYHGTIGESSGGSFCLLWEGTNNLRNAELAIASFCAITAAVTKSPILDDYRRHPSIQQKITNFRVHFIGGIDRGFIFKRISSISQGVYKNDHTGPTLARASQISKLSGIYKIGLLISEKALSIDDWSSWGFRKIINLSAELPALFTLDLDVESLSVWERKVLNKSLGLKMRLREFMKRMLSTSKSVIKQRINKDNEDFDVLGYLRLSRDFQDMREKFENENGRRWKDLWDLGFINYVAEEYEIAALAFKQTSILPTKSETFDGPSLYLLECISRTMR